MRLLVRIWHSAALGFLRWQADRALDRAVRTRRALTRYCDRLEARYFPAPAGWRVPSVRR